MQEATIFSTGMYVPEQIIRNEFFNDLYGEDVDTWLKEHVQIYERHWCTSDQSTADLAVAAGEQAIQKANITAAQIDLIIIATDTPEYISPSTASVVQARLKATRAGTFDLNSACAGFVTSLDLAAKYMMADCQYQFILVIGVYAMSKYLNMDDKKTATLFADGAGAVILKSKMNTGAGWKAGILKTQGEYHDWMGIYAGGTKKTIDHESLHHGENLLRFVKKIPKSINAEVWTELIQSMANQMKIRVEEVDHFLFTQINIFSIWDTLDRLKVSHEKAHTIMHQYGYTGSACIPMALHDAIEKEIIKKGDLVFFISSGGGLAFAATAFRI